MPDYSEAARAAVGVQSMVGESADETSYDERMGVRSKHYLTMLAREDTDWIVGRVSNLVRDKIVVEIGAGLGVLACEIAKLAKHVFAIEADPGWSWTFARHLYRDKPANLTYIFDRAENLVDVIRADVAIVVTGSDEVGLRQLGLRFAPAVILPWQDWNDGKAIVGWGPFGASHGAQCQCVYGCVMDGADGIPLAPRQHCQLRAIGAKR